MNSGSRYSGTARVRFPAGVRDFHFSTACRLALGPTWSSSQCVPETLTAGVKLSGLEAIYLPPSSAEANNGGAIPSLPIRLHGTRVSTSGHQSVYSSVTDLKLLSAGTLHRVVWYEFRRNRCKYRKLHGVTSKKVKKKQIDEIVSAPHSEDIWGVYGCIAPCIRHWTEVNAHLHAPAPFPLYRKLGGPQGRSG